MQNTVSSQTFRSYARLTKALAIMIFINIIFGPLVRATNSGLACPDWPLCHGKFVPEYTFTIAMEVGHRYYSGILGIFLFALFIWVLANPVLRKEFLLIASLSVLLLGSQVLLGGLTVLKLLDPTTVNMHLLNAIALFLSIVTLSVQSSELSKEPYRFKWNKIKRKENILFAITAIGIVIQIIAGARVSSHYAGLACPDFPTCNGSWFPAMDGLIRFQMEHRFGGYIVSILVFASLITAIWKKLSYEVKLYYKLAANFILVQIALGAFNIYMQIPKLLTAFHTGIATLIFLFVYLAFLQNMKASNGDNK